MKSTKVKPHMKLDLKNICEELLHAFQKKAITLALYMLANNLNAEHNK